MLTYSEAKEMLSRTRHGRRKLENNTYLEERTAPALGAALDGSYKFADGRQVQAQETRYAVRLHNTDVVTLHPDGSQTYNSGGWRTVTTKDRINRYGLARVHSDRGTWYVQLHDYEHPVAHLRPVVPFADGMRIFPSGRMLGAGTDTAALRTVVLKKVSAYIDAYAADAVQRGGLVQPGPGDCWGCCMRAQDADKRPPGTGMIMGVDHLLSHFEERYFVPSLLWNALQRRGDPAFCWGMMNAEVARGDTRFLKGELRAYFRPLIPAIVDALAAAEKESAQ